MEATNIKYMFQGYEDDPEPDDEDEEDASYADEEYGVPKPPKKVSGSSGSTSKKRKAPSKPRVVARHSPSDSDSDYGSRSKKKKRPRVSGDEIRVSSRGTKVPNYVDDVQDFEQYEEDEIIPGGYVDPNAVQKEEDEIEGVLGHSRDDDAEEGLDDNWYTNIVRSPLDYMRSRLYIVHSVSISNGKTSPTSTTPTRRTSS